VENLSTCSCQKLLVSLFTLGTSDLLKIGPILILKLIFANYGTVRALTLNPSEIQRCFGISQVRLGHFTSGFLACSFLQDINWSFHVEPDFFLESLRI
jgi:hypothetical protein